MSVDEGGRQETVDEQANRGAEGGIEPGRSTPADATSVADLPENQRRSQSQSRIEKIRDTISNAVTDLVCVRVITAVGDEPIMVVRDEKSVHRTVAELKQGSLTQAFVTELNLLDGDTMAVEPKNYGDHEKLAELHTENVDRATKVVRDNIEAVVNAARAVIEVLQDNDDG